MKQMFDLNLDPMYRSLMMERSTVDNMNRSFNIPEQLSFDHGKFFVNEFDFVKQSVWKKFRVYLSWSRTV